MKESQQCPTGTSTTNTTTTHRTTSSNNNYPTTPNEIHVQSILETITYVISTIRSIDQFNPIKKLSLGKDLKKTLNKVQNNSYDLEKDDDGMIFVYRHLIQSNPELCDKIQQFTFLSTRKKNYFGDINRNINICHPLEKDRYQLVHTIFLPLLTALTEAYAIIDNNTMDTSTDSSNTINTANGISNIIKSKHRNKPKAPKHLLSLSNYTDIASLIELTICTSIIPKLESNVLLDIKDRSTFCLPKSLQGRLRKQTLVWGMNVANKINSSANKTTTVNTNNTNKSNQHEEKLQMAIHNIQNAKQELSIVIHTITQIILLDRFRPMLLPRHVTDVYAVIFQLERLDDLEENFLKLLHPNNHSLISLSSSEMIVSWIRQIFLNEKKNIHECNQEQQQEHYTIPYQYHVLQNSIQPMIDIYAKVKSFQSLLLNGKKTPLWLRLRVGQLLTDIAIQKEQYQDKINLDNNDIGTTNHNIAVQGLQAIIDIFVVAASSLPTEEMTGASLRLSKVLCTVDEKENVLYYKQLLGQFILLLDNLTYYQGEKKQPHNGGDGDNDDELNARIVANILTIWAVLEHVSIEIGTECFFVPLVKGLIPTDPSSNSTSSSSIKSSIGCVQFLLMYTPPGNCNTDHVLYHFCHFLISNYVAASDINISYPSAPGIISPLGQLLRVACAEGNKVIQSDGVKMASDTMKMIIYTTIAKCRNASSMNSIEMDIAIAILQNVIMNPIDLMGYHFSRGEKNRGEISFGIAGGDVNDVERKIFGALEERTKFVINTLLNVKHGDIQQFLPNAMFRLLLLIYFASSQNAANRSTDLLPPTISIKFDDYKIVAMMMLPILCENFSPDLLFMDNDLDSNGVIQIVSLIVSTIATQYVTEENENSSTREGDIGTQLSIVSIVLSLLVAMLELGCEKRSTEEENDLKSMLPSLQALTRLTGSTFQDPKCGHMEESERSKLDVLKAEIAEMSSHAMAIIFARSAPEVQQNELLHMENASDIDYMYKIINDAETQLLSEQPPLRARAIVQLRQLARGQLEEVMNADGKERSTIPAPLIMELDDNDSTMSRVEPRLIVIDMLRLCIKSLDDTESYVYLASIQTIVSIVDVHPSLSMPILVDAITLGYVQVPLDHHPVPTTKSTTLELSSSQRIKCAEALIFSIRRRGDAISSYVDVIMNNILFGKNHSSIGYSSPGLNKTKDIQRETELYFRPQCETDQPFDEYAIPLDNSEAKQLRLNTGGPVYDAEESDVVRAACINVLAELISTIHPATAESYCHILVHLGLNALRLDHSRVVRRSAALLCRELYSCALRETVDLTENAKLVDVSFTMALIKCYESLLRNFLERCVAGDDVDVNLGHETLNSVKGKTRLYDSATVARCKEALDIRNTIYDSGMLGLIELHVKSQVGEKNSILSFVKKEVDKSTPTTQLLDISPLPL